VGAGAPRTRIPSKCSVCKLNIMLILALCIKMHQNIPFPDGKTENFLGRGLTAKKFFSAPRSDGSLSNTILHAEVKVTPS